jgi:hypothetical protein
VGQAGLRFLRKTNGTVTSQLQLGSCYRGGFLVSLLIASWEVWIRVTSGTEKFPGRLRQWEGHAQRRDGALSVVGNFVRGWRWDCVFVVHGHGPRCCREQRELNQISKSFGIGDNVLTASAEPSRSNLSAAERYRASAPGHETFPLMVS